MPKQIRLNLIFHTSGRHDAGWKSFEDPSILIDDADHQIKLAKLAEEAKFDAIFLPDTPAVLGRNFLRKPRRGLDPAVLLAAIAMETKHLGLISTTSLLHNHPYFAARAIASLQQISKGRAGLNVVTSQNDQSLEALGFPVDAKLDRETRYAKSTEFMEILLGLWDSLPKEAITADKENDVYIDLSKAHPIDFQGEFYSSKGTMQMTGRYDGARPLIFQAGISPQSRVFGAKYADALFTSQPTVDHDRKFYAEVKSLAAQHGRNPDHLIVLPGLYAVVGDSEKDARHRKAEFDEMMSLEFLVNGLARQLELPVELLDPNKELDYDLFDKFPTDDEIILYRRRNIGGESKEHGFTVKQLVHHNLTRGQRALFGTAEQIADQIIEWVDTDVSDGFNINVDVQFDGMERFKEVIYVLQEKGRFRKDYQEGNFRENYGLPKV